MSECLTAWSFTMPSNSTSNAYFITEDAPSDSRNRGHFTSYPVRRFIRCLGIFIGNLSFSAGRANTDFAISRIIFRATHTSMAHCFWSFPVNVCGLGTSERLWHISGLVYRESAAKLLPVGHLMDWLVTAWSPFPHRTTCAGRIPK